MTKAGKSLTTHVTAPITALGTAAVKASIDYEYAFADVRKTVDATEEEAVHIDAGLPFTSTRVNEMGDQPVNIENETAHSKF